MSDKTGIEWTEATWNPTTGCSKVSQGCKNCYALRDWARLAAPRTPPNVYTGRAFTDVAVHPERLNQPLRWTKPRRIFVNSMSDLFHEDVPGEFIDRVFAVMALCPRHTFQVLTKRPERMRDYIGDLHPGSKRVLSIRQATVEFLALAGFPVWPILFPLPNVWLGVSVENQETADERIPLLLQTPAAVRWLSMEPLLGPTLVDTYLGDLPEDDDGAPYPGKIDWVVVGGESGPKARPMHLDWVRSLRDQCQAAGVPFLFKQWGEWQVASVENGHFDSDMARNDAYWIDQNGAAHKPSSLGLINPIAMARVGKKAAGRELDGRLWDEYPGAANERV